MKNKCNMYVSTDNDYEREIFSKREDLSYLLSKINLEMSDLIHTVESSEDRLKLQRKLKLFQNNFNTSIGHLGIAMNKLDDFLSTYDKLSGGK